VNDWSSRLAAGPPLALSMSKRLLDQSSSVSLAQALEAEALAQNVNFQSKDTAEAMIAFVQKREPRFEGN
jgi:2-(1,2-epoxy-1,2-dihydrophenyl)acetyl-CoA isomerase